MRAPQLNWDAYQDAEDNLAMMEVWEKRASRQRRRRWTSKCASRSKRRELASLALATWEVCGLPEKPATQVATPVRPKVPETRASRPILVLWTTVVAAVLRAVRRLLSRRQS